MIPGLGRAVSSLGVAGDTWTAEIRSGRRDFFAMSGDHWRDADVRPGMESGDHLERVWGSSGEVWGSFRNVWGSPMIPHQYTRTSPIGTYHRPTHFRGWFANATHDRAREGFEANSIEAAEVWR